jgi:uncharacterized protein YciW
VYGRNPAYAAEQSGTRMQQTREEIANLVKKSAATREKTAETDSRLSRLMAYAESVVQRKKLPSTPDPKVHSYKSDIQR